MFKVNDVEFNDKKTFDLISNGKTKNIFQLESDLCQNWSKKLKPQTIDHIAALISIVRPGALKTGAAESFCNRKNGQEKVEYEIPALEEALSDTYGMLIYQEQIMEIAQKLGGFSEEETDNFRRAVGKKDAKLMSSLKDDFIKGCVKVGKVTAEQADKIFEDIRKSEAYLFNASHAYEYAFTSYRTGYLKDNYPTEFTTACLIHSGGKQNTHEYIEEVINDVKSSGIRVLPPKFSDKNISFEISQPGVIRYGLSSIKNIGESSLKSIQKTKADSSWCEFVLWAQKICRRVYEALIKSGACDYFDMSRTRMIEELAIIYGNSDEYKPLTKKELPEFLEFWATNCDKVVSNNLIAGLQHILDKNLCTKLRRPVIEEKIKQAQAALSLVDTNTRKAVWEKMFLGLALTCSAADDFKEYNHRKLVDIVEDPMNQGQTSCVVVDKITKKLTKSGNEYIIADVSDNSAVAKYVTVWPKDYNKVAKDFKTDCVCQIDLKPDWWQGKKKLIGSNIKVF